jgi:hypothetical protein
MLGRMVAPSSERCSRARFREGWLAATLLFFFIVEAWSAGTGKFLSQSARLREQLIRRFKKCRREVGSLDGLGGGQRIEAS